MNIVRVETLRRLIPALAVGSVLAFSLFAASPTLASSTNNCGVKGYGYHDHGKVCPNRPFPGKGVGLAKFGILSLTNSGKQVSAHAKVTLNVRLGTETSATASTTKTKGHSGTNG